MEAKQRIEHKEITEKNSDNPPVCFVIMPIADVAGYEPGHFGRVYEYLLKPAIKAAGYDPVRADDAVKTDYIVVGIIQKIVESPMVICDFSARNANVMYELGIRHAFNKPVVLIKDNRTDKIFDIQGLRYAEYDPSLRIDAVNKDMAKIASAIKETANADPKDLNSVVQLAGIKTADLPASQTVSPDTKLLLSAIGSLERRLDSVEKRPILPGATLAASEGGIVIATDSAVLMDGSKIENGDTLYRDGNLVGIVTGFDPSRYALTVESAHGGSTFVPGDSPLAKKLSLVPF